MADEKRRLEISNKFIEMGQALLREGGELEDYPIAQSGTIMIILANVILSEEDTLIFSELCAMFSAKKVIMDMQNDDNKPLANLLKKKKAELKPKSRKGKGPDDEVK